MAETTPGSPTFSRTRRFGRGAASVVGIVCLLAITVMVNYLATGWYRRWDWSHGARFVLSPMTERLLQTITNDVDVVVCFDPRGNEEVYGWTRSLLEQYQNGNPRIRVAAVDSARSPGTAAQVIATNQLSTLKAKDFIVFNCGGHRRVVFANELSDYDTGSMVNGEREIKRTAFKGELAFSSALFAVTYPRQQRAYFVTGHNEMDPGNGVADTGYGKFATMLREECNVDWAKVSLRGTNDLSDASMLVFAGSREIRFEADEIAKLDGYLRKGGRALFLMNNTSLGRPSGIEYYLTNWNVVSQYGVVRDPRAVATENDLLTAKLNPIHPITRALALQDPPLPIRLVLPRLVSRMGDNGPANGINVDVLASTSDEGVECHLHFDGGTVVTNCINGSLPLMVAVEQGGIAGVSADRGTTRLVVIGDTYCFNNQLLDGGANRYFAGFVVNWLLDRPQAMLQIPPKPVREYRLIMGAAQQRQLIWILLGAMPGGALLLGGLVWLRRRR